MEQSEHLMHLFGFPFSHDEQPSVRQLSQFPSLFNFWSGEGHWQTPFMSWRFLSQSLHMDGSSEKQEEQPEIKQREHFPNSLSFSLDYLQ